MGGILQAYVDCGLSTKELYVFVDACEVPVRSSTLPRGLRSALTRRGALSCMVVALHLPLGQHDHHWHVVARYVDKEDNSHLRGVLVHQLLSLQWRKALPQGVTLKVVADFKALSCMLGHVPASNEHACPFCKLSKLEWRQPVNYTSCFENAPSDLDYPDACFHLSCMEDWVYDPMHMCTQVFYQVLCAVWFWAQTQGVGDELQAFLQETRTPFVAPPTRQVGNAEPTPLCREALHTLKNMRWWYQLGTKMPYLSAVGRTADGEEVVIHDAMQTLLQLTSSMLSVMYSDTVEMSIAEYKAMGEQWGYAYTLLNLEQSRWTTPVHVWQTHACVLARQPTVKIAAQGGERMHQRIKTLVAKHPRFYDSTIPVSIREDLRHAALEVALLPETLVGNS